MFVLASHGNYALETLKSCEMITGHLNNFTAISFHNPMGVDDLAKKYQQIYASANKNSSFTIIVDIPNGSPANAAKLFMAKHTNVKLYTGLSFILVLAIATGTPLDQAVNQAKKATGNIQKQPKTPPTTNKAEKPKPINPKADPIINVRVDSRLIHGQIATMWTRTLQATRIMIIDDQVVKSNIQKTTLKAAMPGGVHLSILTAQGAADRIKRNQYAGQRVFIIVKNPEVLKTLVGDGVKLKEINIGNMSMTEGAKQIAKSVAVTPKDITIFNSLIQKGIKVYYQMIPNNKKQNFTSMVKEKERK